MTIPYGVISDPHYHRWDAFSTTNADGLNSRLEIQLDATIFDEKAANKLIHIIRNFIEQTMIDNDISSCTLVYDDVSEINSVHVRQTHEKTLEQKLMECPIWATW